MDSSPEQSDHGNRRRKWYRAIVEITSLLGSSSAISGGGSWIPRNPLIVEAGVHHSCDDARLYMDTVIGDLGPDQEVAVEGRISDRLSRASADVRGLFFHSGLLRDVRIDHIHVPWQRLSEAGFDVRVDLA